MMGMMKLMNLCDDLVRLPNTPRCHPSPLVDNVWGERNARGPLVAHEPLRLV